MKWILEKFFSNTEIFLFIIQPVELIKLIFEEVAYF